MTEKTETCLKCGSGKIISEARIIDRGDYNAEGFLRVAVDEYPDALMFKQRARAECFASVCGDCGFVEIYAKSPEILYAAFQNRKNNSAE